MKFTVDAINLFKLAFLMLIMLFLLEGIQAQQICNSAVQVTSSCYQNQTNAGQINELIRYGSLAANGPEKIYKLSLTSNSNVQIGLEIIQEGLNLDLYLINWNCSTGTGRLIANSNSDNLSTNLEFIESNNLAAGTYYVIVDGPLNNSIGNFNRGVNMI
jgi:hypothetical protein